MARIFVDRSSGNRGARLPEGGVTEYQVGISRAQMIVAHIESVVVDSAREAGHGTTLVRSIEPAPTEHCVLSTTGHERNLGRMTKSTLWKRRKCLYHMRGWLSSAEP